MNQSETGNTIDNLDLSNIDFDKLEDVTQCAGAICQAANDSGMFSSAYPMGREFSRIRLSAKEWLREIDSRLNKLSPAEGLEAIGSYDIIHRIGYGKPASPETINKHVLRAFDAMIHGNTSVDQYAVYKAIAEGLRRRDPEYFDKPLSWLTTIEERWYKEAKCGYALNNLPASDIISRVSILLRADHTAYEGRNQSAFKHQLINKHSHYLADNRLCIDLR